MSLRCLEEEVIRTDDDNIRRDILLNKQRKEFLNGICRIVSKEQCDAFAFKRIFQILSNVEFDKNESDSVFEYIYKNQDLINNDIFNEYISYSSQGTFFSKNDDNEWLLNFYYCLYDNNIGNFSIFHNEVIKSKENTDKNNFKENKYFINGIDIITDTVSSFKNTHNEDLIIKDFINYNYMTNKNFKKIIERYSLIFVKILNYLYRNNRLYFSIVSKIFIENYRYTETYKKIMVRYYQVLSKT